MDIFLLETTAVLSDISDILTVKYLMSQGGRPSAVVVLTRCLGIFGSESHEHVWEWYIWAIQDKASQAQPRLDLALYQPGKTKVCTLILKNTLYAIFLF